MLPLPCTCTVQCSFDIGLESGDEVVCVFLCAIFYAEIIDHQAKGNIASMMFEQTESVRALNVNVAVGLKVSNQAKLAKATGLRETVHIYGFGSGQYCCETGVQGCGRR